MRVLREEDVVPALWTGRHTAIEEIETALCLAQSTQLFSLAMWWGSCKTHAATPWSDLDLVLVVRSGNWRGVCDVVSALYSVAGRHGQELDVMYTSLTTPPDRSKLSSLADAVRLSDGRAVIFGCASDLTTIKHPHANVANRDEVLRYIIHKISRAVAFQNECRGSPIAKPLGDLKMLHALAKVVNAPKHALRKNAWRSGKDCTPEMWKHTVPPHIYELYEEIERVLERYRLAFCRLYQSRGGRGCERVFVGDATGDTLALEYNNQIDELIVSGVPLTLAFLTECANWMDS